jgi:hypothetical protein
MADLIGFKDGLIHSIEMFFDPRPFDARCVAECGLSIRTKDQTMIFRSVVRDLDTGDTQ